MFPRVTHPSATKCKSKLLHSVRLACVKRAASVRSEPGSNSQVKLSVPRKPPASYLSDASQIYTRPSKLRRLYILSFLFFTSFNDRVSIYILSPFLRQPIFLLFFNFYPYLNLISCIFLLSRIISQMHAMRNIQDLRVRVVEFLKKGRPI